MLLLPENCKLYERLSGVMLNAQHLKMVQSVTLTEAYIQLKLVQVLPTVIHSSVLILLRKSKNDGAIRRNMLFMDPVWDSFPFYMRTVQSQTPKVTRVGPATNTQSGRSEFIFRPVPCKRMKRNVWRPIRTRTMSSSRSRVITPLVPFVSRYM